MNAIDLPDDLKRCVEFHGHLCPGVIIGYVAATFGLERLGRSRAEDEEVIAIVENKSCAVDAIQVLTGCTFGKGNLFFHDYGKMAFIFAARDDGRSVRLMLREQTISDESREARIARMLSADPATLFDVQDNPLRTLPEPARIEESLRCDRCGERVMASRTFRYRDETLCVTCHVAAVSDQT